MWSLSLTGVITNCQSYQVLTLSEENKTIRFKENTEKAQCVIQNLSYYLFLLDRVMSLSELLCRSKCGDSKLMSQCYRRKQINVMWCTKPVNAWFFIFSYYALIELLWKYKKRILLRCLHHSKSDLINNMAHMRILGTGKFIVPSLSLRNYTFYSNTMRA